MVVEKEKNPKRVAAGKALADRNRKYKVHFEKTAGATKTMATAEKPPTATATATATSSNSTYFIAGVVILVTVGFAYYQSQQKPKADGKVAIEKPEASARPIVTAKPNRLITV